MQKNPGYSFFELAKILAMIGSIIIAISAIGNQSIMGLMSQINNGILYISTNNISNYTYSAYSNYLVNASNSLEGITNITILLLRIGGIFILASLLSWYYGFHLENKTRKNSPR